MSTKERLDSADRLCIRLLGRLQLVGSNGADIRLPTRKAEALAAWLAVVPGEPTARTDLADLLWSRSGDQQARGSLRQELARLRKALGGHSDLLISNSKEVCLDGDRVASDLARLNALLGRSDLASLREAWDLYSDEPLAGFAAADPVFDAWLDELRADLAMRAVGAFERLFHGLIEADAFAEAEQVARRIAKLDIYSERARKLLAQALIGQDKRGAALSMLAEFETLLREDLDVEPSSDLVRFRSDIAKARPALLGGPMSRPPAAPLGRRLSVAVLPFAQAAVGDEIEFFGMGLSEDIAAELVRFQTLRVIAWHSTRTVGDQSATASSIGEQLGARYLVQGSVQSSDDGLLLRVYLVDAADGAQVWAERFTIPEGEIVRTRRLLASRIVSMLMLRLEGDIVRQARGRPVDELAPYDLWLRGWERVKRGTVEDDDAARALFEKALEIDPTFARAHTGLSLSHFNEWSCQHWNQWGEKERLCHLHASQAVELDESDHVANMILGRVQLFRREFEAAERRLDRSRQLNPNDPDCLAQLSYAYALLGRPEDCRTCADDARFLNPFYPDWYGTFIAPAFFLTGDLETAVRLAETSPDQFVDTRIFLALTYALLGNPERARLNGRKFVDNYGRKIAYGQPFADEDPIRWFFAVNPVRDRSMVERFWPALQQTGIPMPDRPDSILPEAAST